MRTADVDEESAVEIVDIVSLKFASDEAAGLTSWNRYLTCYAQPVCIETSLPKVRKHYCCFIRIALIIQVQKQERTMRLISNMRFLASCAY